MSHGGPTAIALLLGAVFLVLCVFASKLSSRLGVPALVLFIGIGMLAGSEGPGGIPFSDFALTKELGMILLGFILFSGGLDTDWKHIRPVVWRGLSLSTIGVLATAGLIGAFANAFLGFTILEGLILGAIVSSTDAAAIFSVLRGRGLVLKHRIAPLLEVESGSNDPIAVLLAAGLTDLATNPESSPWTLALSVAQQMPMGILVGFVMGKGAVWLINHLRLEYDGLYPMITIAAAAATYGIAPYAGGNEFIAVYAAGVTLGSSVFVHKISLVQFHDGIAWLLQIAVFVALGLLAFPSQVLKVVGPGIALALFIMIFARPIAVNIALFRVKMTRRSKLFVACAGLRGAFPIILATLPALAGQPKGQTIFNLVFFVVVVSVLVQGAALRPLAKRLGVLAERPAGGDLQPAQHSELIEIVLDPQSPSVGKQVVELGLPATALIVLLKRGSSNYIPRGSTILMPGDRLLLATRREDHDELRLKIGGVQTLRDSEAVAGDPA
ncbi:MAG: potassium/proton antiporter [Fimbriimonadaceae bacterium]|nr:potassium/proton antiporter [Fimbriimonadaceae bacterium]